MSEVVLGRHTCYACTNVKNTRRFKMKVFKKAAAVLSAALLLVAGVAVGTNLNDSRTPLRAQNTAAGYNDVTYGGAVRCVNGVWGTINDAGHMSEGITSVTATSTYVQVN